MVLVCSAAGSLALIGWSTEQTTSTGGQIQFHSRRIRVQSNPCQHDSQFPAPFQPLVPTVIKIQDCSVTSLKGRTCKCPRYSAGTQSNSSFDGSVNHTKVNCAYISMRSASFVGFMARNRRAATSPFDGNGAHIAPLQRA